MKYFNLILFSLLTVLCLALSVWMFSFHLGLSAIMFAVACIMFVFVVHDVKALL